MAYHRLPPGLFLLHCLAHGRRFDVRRRLSRRHDIRCWRPLIGLGEDGETAEIHFNIQCMHAPAVDQEEMDAVYRAYRKFAALIDDARFRLRFRLAPGEVVGFDNSRVLLGRTAFDESGGRRHLRGIYIDRDELLSRIRMLERRR